MLPEPCYIVCLKHMLSVTDSEYLYNYWKSRAEIEEKEHPETLALNGCASIIIVLLWHYLIRGIYWLVQQVPEHIPKMMLPWKILSFGHYSSNSKNTNLVTTYYNHYGNTINAHFWFLFQYFFHCFYMFWYISSLYYKPTNAVLHWISIDNK